MQKFNELFMRIQQVNEIQEANRILACNDKTEQFGLTLSEEEAAQLMICRRDSLKEHQRVEFKEGILPSLIDSFCDSQYVDQENYLELLAELQDVFYLYKNESQDKLSDDELIDFMREQFEETCCGSIEYLSETCLERFARAIRAGYRSNKTHGVKDEYAGKDSQNEYTQFSEEVRWDRELYWEALRDLM